MTDENLTVSFTVPQSPEEVFTAISRVRDWWSGEIDGDTARLGGEFTYRYEDMHRSTQRVTEFVPGERVVWHVIDAYLSFVEDKTEWVGTDITFDITPVGNSADSTQVRFTHVGLTPSVECYEACAPAWSFYIADSLRTLIVDEAGQPNEREGANA